MASKKAAAEGVRVKGSSRPTRRGEPEPDPSGHDGDATDAAAGPSAKTSSTAPASSSSAVKPADATETATDLSSPHSVRQKEKVSSTATPSSPAANKKGGSAAGPSSKTPPVPPSSSSSSSSGKPADRKETTTVLTPPPSVQKADSRAADRGGQKVSKIPVMWSPEKVKGAALGLLSKRSPPSQPAGQTPDRTGDPTDLSSSPQKENISEDASSAEPPSKMARLCSDAAVAALSAAMDLLAKTSPAPPSASTPGAKQRNQRNSYAKQIKMLKDADPSPAIMRRYRPERYKSERERRAAESHSSPAIMRRGRPGEPHPAPAIMRRKTFRSKIKQEGTSPLTTAKSGQKAYDRRADMKQKVIMTRCAPKFKSPPKFKVTGAVFCEGRVMGLLATRPIAGASTSSPAVKQRAPLTSAPPAQKAAGGQVVVMFPQDKFKGPGASTSPSAKTFDPDATPAIMRRNRPDRQKTPPVHPSSSSSPVKRADWTEVTNALMSKEADRGQAGSIVTVRWSPDKAKGAAVINPSLKTLPVPSSSSSSPGTPADQRADKRPADRGGQTGSKVPVTWSAEKVKGATMGLLAKAADPSSSTQSVQRADERPVDRGLTKVPVTWSPEKVKGVISILAKRSAPSSSSDPTEMENEDALAVLRLRQRIRPQRKVIKKGPLQKIAHHVKLGHYNKLPADIMAIPGLYDSVVTEVMKRVKEECAGVTRNSFGSVLRQTSLQSLKNFRWEDLVEEWRTSAPTFLKFLQSAASVSLDGSKAGADTAEAKTKKRVAAMAGAMVLHARSRHMRAPMVRNSLLLHANDKKRCFQRFRTQGLCVSYKQTLQKIKEMGETYDKEVLQWKEDAIVGGKRQAAAEGEMPSVDESTVVVGGTAGNAESHQEEDPQDGGGENMLTGISSSSAGGQCENATPEPGLVQ